MKKILIVEDDPQVTALLCDILQSDHDVSSARNGLEALDKLAQENFDLLLCDMWMPQMNGLQLLEKLKDLPEPPAAIMLTADDTPDLMLKAVRAQARHLLKKPFHAAELLKVVRSTLSEPLPSPIEVISARPEWVELLVTCELRNVDRVYELMLKLKADLPEELRESVGQALRELLHNAMEWGGEMDASRKVRISFLRARRMLIYRISDPGRGFKFQDVDHAAIGNPVHDPLSYIRIREEKGLRPGGLGIVLTQALVDELLYNEAQNEVLFVKYLD